MSTIAFTRIGTLNVWLAEHLVHPKMTCPFRSLLSQRRVFCSQTHEHCSRKCSLTPVGFRALLIDDHRVTNVTMQGPLWTLSAPVGDHHCFRGCLVSPRHPRACVVSKHSEKKCANKFSHLLTSHQQSHIVAQMIFKYE